MKQNFVYDGEFLVHKGDALDYFYFVSSGALEIYFEGKLAAVAGLITFYATVPARINPVKNASRVSCSGSGVVASRVFRASGLGLWQTRFLRAATCEGALLETLQ